MKGAVIAAGLWALTACGGGPGTRTSLSLAPPDASERLEVAFAVGRALDWCVDEDAKLTVLYPFTVEQWQLGEAPALVERHSLDRVVSALGCMPDNLGPPAGDHSNHKLMADGERRGLTYAVTLDPDEWRVSSGGRVILRRAHHQVFTAAAFDGQAAWAVDAHALWRWVPGAAQPLRSALPPDLVEKPIESVFFEGPVLWLREAPNMGHPLIVDGPTLERVKPPGTLGPLATGPITLPVGGALVRLSLGTTDATIDDAPWAIAPASAVLPWGGGLVLAEAQRLVWWRVEAGQATEVAAIDVGGPTVALFDAGDTIVAVGAYGFVALKRSSSPPRTPPSAP